MDEMDGRLLQIEKLSAERDRYRKALQRLAAHGTHLDLNPTLGGRLGDGTDPVAWSIYLRDGDQTVREIARTALAGDPQRDED